VVSVTNIELRHQQNTLSSVYKKQRPIDLEINPLNAQLNTICHLLPLLGAHLILHISRIRVKKPKFIYPFLKLLKFIRTINAGVNDMSIVRLYHINQGNALFKLIF